MIKSLAAERMNRGLTQTAMGEALGVSPKTIANIENGSRPTPRIGKKIADLFGCKYTDLWPLEQAEKETA